MTKLYHSVSHILNIYGKEEPKNKGNLFLSGVIALDKVELKELGIDCVVTVLNE